ncbi:hypothetical protein V8E36_001878 [Tilletia maclaganii]
MPKHSSSDKTSTSAPTSSTTRGSMHIMAADLDLGPPTTEPSSSSPIDRLDIYLSPDHDHSDPRRSRPLPSPTSASASLPTADLSTFLDLNTDWTSGRRLHPPTAVVSLCLSSQAHLLKPRSCSSGTASPSHSNHTSLSMTACWPPYTFVVIVHRPHRPELPSIHRHLILNAPSTTSTFTDYLPILSALNASSFTRTYFIHRPLVLRVAPSRACFQLFISESQDPPKPPSPSSPTVAFTFKMPSSRLEAALSRPRPLPADPASGSTFLSDSVIVSRFPMHTGPTIMRPPALPSPDVDSELV